MINVYLGLGSNLGDREANILTAIKLLEQHEDINVNKVSSLIETEYVGPGKQPNYINGVAQIETNLSPQELLNYTKGLEKLLGRVGKGQWVSRPIDIDILFYGKEVICEDDLTIPHPLVHERKFVLTPMYEIAKDFEHPILMKTIAFLYNRLL
jgi:2-amino-4-hydroxy-6-hydroxymethyldihydropteridine diphosphokinase